MFVRLFGNHQGPDTHRHIVTPQQGEWPKMSSSLVLVRQTSNHAEIISDLGLIRGLPYGLLQEIFLLKFCMNYSPFLKLLDTLKITNEMFWCYCLLEMQSFVLYTFEY
jgi:hypothetical protein